jgi:ribosome biogenesis protein UTP30
LTDARQIDRLFFGCRRVERAPLRSLGGWLPFRHRRRRKLRARIPPPHRTHTFAAMSNKVDAAQVTKAVAALRKHSEKVKAEGGSKLFDGDDDDDAETYSVMVSTRRVPQRASNKLVPIPLPHPLLSLDVAEVCLIVKDHQGEGHKDAKRKVAEMEKCGVAKVLGISKLRNNYKPHEAKRKLCDSYDLFLADARVLPLLPKLLGKTFFKKKRQPVPVDLTKKDWPAQVRKAAAATYARRGAGTCVSVKVGRAAHSQKEIVANAVAAIDGVVERVVARKWANVQAVFLKTTESVALPVYNALPDAEEDAKARVEEEAAREARDAERKAQRDAE